MPKPCTPTARSAGCSCLWYDEVAKAWSKAPLPGYGPGAPERCLRRPPDINPDMFCPLHGLNAGDPSPGDSGDEHPPTA